MAFDATKVLQWKLALNFVVILSKILALHYLPRTVDTDKFVVSLVRLLVQFILIFWVSLSFYDKQSQNL